MKTIQNAYFCADIHIYHVWARLTLEQNYSKTVLLYNAFKKTIFHSNVETITCNINFSCPPFSYLIRFEGYKLQKYIYATVYLFKNRSSGILFLYCDVKLYCNRKKLKFLFQNLIFTCDIWKNRPRNIKCWYFTLLKKRKKKIQEFNPT